MTHRDFLKAALLLLLPSAASAALTTTNSAILDMTFLPRTTFTNSEQLVLQQTVNNSAQSSNRVFFTFQIFSPSGAKVFQQSGNQAPGSPGNAQTQVAGIPISGFYSQPGTYKMIAIASLDSFTVQQTQYFTVSSPNVTLIYPPNGTQNLTDSPVIFRWVSSGAAQYKVMVDISPSFYYNLFNQTISGVNNFFTYPVTPNPPDPRVNLSAGQVYYWQVLGLDANGNQISSSGVPFSFTVSGQATALTRDLAVTGLVLVPPSQPTDPGPLPFSVTVKNQGGTTEGNIPLAFTLGGLPAPESPQSVSLTPGQSQSYLFHAQAPTGMGQTIAVACLNFFDDNANNNCATMQLGTLATGVGVAASISTGAVSGAAVDLDSAWQTIQNGLPADIQQQLSGYQLVGVTGASQQDLSTLVTNLNQGKTSITASVPQDTTVTSGGGAPFSDAFLSTSTGIGGPIAPPSADAGTTTQESPATGSGLDMNQAWQTISGGLPSSIQQQLGNYQLVGINGVNQQDAILLVNNIAQGKTTITALAPPQDVSPSAPAFSGIVLSTGAGVAGPAAVPPAADMGLEWSGRTTYLTMNTSHLLLRRKDSWEKIWKAISPEPVPSVDFSKYVVIGLVAGTKARAKLISVESIETEGDRMVVRYRLAGQQGERQSWEPFYFRAIPRTSVPLIFKESKSQ